MRKIEQQMVNALRSGCTWHKDNTMVHCNGDVYLHNNHIANVSPDTGKVTVNLYTLRKWPSMTTRSRLRALGADLVSIKGTLHLNGKSIYAE